MSDIIYVHNYQEFLSYESKLGLNRFKNKTIFEFDCCDCGKRHHKRGLLALADGRLVCRRCKARQFNLEKYGCEHPFQNEEVKRKWKETNLKKYGCENPFQNEQIKEHIKRTSLEKYGCENPAQNEKIKETIKNVFKEKYGCENPFQSEVIKDKIKSTNMEKYGCEYASQNVNVKEKMRKTNLERYGTESACQNYKIREKKRQTNLIRYGSESPLQNKKVRDKCRKAYLEKYGCENPFQNELIKEKIKTTNIEKYGCENPAQNEDIKRKVTNTNLKRYGVERASQNESIKEKARRTNLERYGYESSTQNPAIHKKIFSHRKEVRGGFLSKSEKIFSEMLMGRKLVFEYEFFHNGKHWDFKVGDNLIEIDGEYNHGIFSDVDGHHVCGALDFERSQLAYPYKLLVIDSKKIEQGVDALVSILNMDYEQWIQTVKDSLPTEFPYPSYDEKRMKSDWRKLCSYDWNKRQMLGMSTIYNFHKSIWSSHIGNLPSPVEAWSDKDLLSKCVEERFIYNSPLSSQNIVNGFNLCKLAPRVDVFNPSLARHLTEKYLNEFETVFDPFSGFSERMLGVCSLDKRYVGQDVSVVAVGESNEIKEFLGLDALLTVQDSSKSTGEYECLFTCVQSDEQIDMCLRNFKCKKYLFVVSETDKFKDRVVETIQNKKVVYL